MRVSAYLKRLTVDIDRWTASNLIDPSVGADLVQEARQFHAKARDRENPVLPGLAALSVILGLLTVIAANWDGMNGYMRLAWTFGFFALSMCIAGELRARGERLWSSIAATIGAALFGGGLIVIGQLFHTEATTSGFLSVWTIGALVICLLLAAPMTAVFTGILAIVWTVAHFLEGSNEIVGLMLGPLFALPVWGVLAWGAGNRRALVLVHLLVIGLVFWSGPALYKLTALVSGDEFTRLLALTFFWIGVAIIAELITRTIPFWSSRTIATWMVWLAGAGLILVAIADRFEPHFYSSIDIPLVCLVIFSALTAYGAAPGRRSLRAAGVTGFIATAILFFTLIDNLLLAGLALIGFGVLLIALLLLTNKVLRAPMRKGERA